MLNHDKEYGFWLIMDHLTGALSDNKQGQLDEWRSASDENEELFVWMQKMWKTLCLSDYDETFNKERAYRLFCERVEAENAKRNHITKRNHPAFILPDAHKIKRLRRIALYSAFSLLLIVSVGYFAYRYVIFPSTQEQTILLLEVDAPSGSKKHFSLEDGSKVWLNAGSRLQYDSEYGRTNRALSLFGEAYFEVAKNEQFPFIVNVEGIKIKVLGTHFNVNAYSENNGVSVALLEGSVEMITKKDATMLLPGNMARYDNATGKITAATNAGNNALAWMDNRLVFNGETFEQIICMLERTYNVKVNIQNEQIKKRCFAGDFSNNETIEQIFAIMSFNGKFRYQINGSIINIF